MTAQRSVRSLGENRTTVRTDVEKGAGNSVSAADDEDGDAGDVECGVAAGLADLARCGNDQRQAPEDLGLLSLEVFGVGVTRCRNRDDAVGHGCRSGCAVGKEVFRDGHQVATGDFIRCGLHENNGNDRCSLRPSQTHQAIRRDSSTRFGQACRGVGSAPSDPDVTLRAGLSPSPTMRIELVVSSMCHPSEQTTICRPFSEKTPASQPGQSLARHFARSPAVQQASRRALGLEVADVENP